jgi:hypothetical protein
MPVLKFGIMILIVINVIFGHLDVYYMKCVLLDHHLKQKIWINSIKRSKNVNIKKFQKDTHHNWKKLYHYA